MIKKKLLFFQAKEKGVSGLQIGFIFGAFALVNVIFSPIFGKFVSILSYSPFCEAPSPKAYPHKKNSLKCIFGLYITLLKRSYRWDGAKLQGSQQGWGRGEAKTIDFNHHNQDKLINWWPVRPLYSLTI